MHNNLGPCPLGLWRGAKRSNIIKSQLQSQFQRFLNQIVLLTNERYKHIRWDFRSVAWVMPQGLGLGGAGGQKFNFLNMVMWYIKGAEQ